LLPLLRRIHTGTEFQRPDTRKKEMIDLRRLRYFVAVAEELHFGKAAQRLHMAQPPLTRHITALEGELNLRLFDRSTRSVKLTPDGEMFLPYAKEVVDSVHRAQVASRRAARGKQARFTLGYTSSVPMCDAFAGLIRDFCHQFPGIDLSLVEASTVQQIQNINSGLLDVGIGWRNSLGGHEGCQIKTIATERLIVAVSMDSDLAMSKRLTIESLKNQPFVLFPEEYGSTLNKKTLDLCSTAGYTPQFGPSASQMTTVIALVASACGIAIVPASVSALRKPQVAYIPLADDGAEVELVLMWRENGLSEAARSFVEWQIEVSDRHAESDADLEIALDVGGFARTPPSSSVMQK
jgi:DNA-binding transcriptional LysR family regulator